MAFYELSVISTISATFAVMCVYFYLFALYRQLHIGLWAVFWLMLFVNQLLYRIPLYEHQIAIQIVIHIITIVSHTLLVFATNKFVRKRMNRGWLYWAAIAFIWAALAAFLATPFAIQAFPSCLYAGIVYIWHGLLFWRYPEIQGFGKKVVGMAFISLGIHTLDMPFLLTLKWLAPWGFLLSSIVRFIIALGTLILYLEKNRQDLLAKEKSYRLLAENAADVIYRYQIFPVPHFDYVSPSITKLSGCGVEEFFSSPEVIHSLVHPSDRRVFESFIQNPALFADKSLIFRFIKRDHTIIWVENKSVPIFENGVCISIEGIIRDITARKDLERDVSRLDRLNTVGQMAANVAHEIRNPLTTVRGYIQLFSAKREFAAYREQLQVLISELDRANLIIKEYLSLSQNRVIELKLSQLNTIVKELYPLIKADAIASNKDVVICLAEVPELYLDGKEIRQLILNLVRNGLEAMQSGGIVTISTKCNGDNDVVLAIQDQGEGMPQHVLDNLGKPFLTTKEQGTGLGLAVCYRIADDHQARIQVESGIGGTTFFIHFKVQ